MDAGVHARLPGSEVAEEIGPRDEASAYEARVSGGKSRVGLDVGVQRADFADIDDLAGAELRQARDDSPGDVAPDAVQEPR